MALSNKETNLWTGVKKILIANRGECSCRVSRTCAKLGLPSVAIFTQDDSHSLHVQAATESKCVASYLDQENILRVAQETGADSIHPGYGFLSENAGFAKMCVSAGLVWLGPSPDVMESLSSKPAARKIAVQVGLPLCEGSPPLQNATDALSWAGQVGYPVLLKPCGGGGGIGMQVCNNEGDIHAHFDKTSAVADRFFADPSLYLETYVVKGRHIEVQVFGDGEGTVVHLGERECSMQRRYQKVVEETPSPALTPELREVVCTLATKLCAHLNYESAGTVEFLFDDDKKKFHFMEVNTRLQVEHGVTELVSKDGIDIVEWMIRQGHTSTKVDLKSFQWAARGSAIQLRVYAEDPLKDFKPSPGTLSQFDLPVDENGSRFDTWCFRGCTVTPSYDPLIVKILQWGPTRSEAIRRLQRTLHKTNIKGPATNLSYLQQVIGSAAFVQGQTYTNTLGSMQFQARCFEVLKPGMGVTVQDYPGRVRQGLWRIGVPPSGPMDHLSSRLANSLVGNAEGCATLEVAFLGPSLKFHTNAVVAVAGAPFKATLNGVQAPQFAPLELQAGDVFAVEQLTTDVGARCYIAVRGGVDVPLYLGSRSTFTKGAFGGHQGRELRPGDVIPISEPCSGNFTRRSLPRDLWPQYHNDWAIGVLPGPMANPDYLTDEDIHMLHTSKWEVHHNSNRLGVRLIGPAPKWSRTDGGEGGSHPSNIHDCAYALGTINFTGDMPVIIAHDGPSLGGFVCPVTIATSELWKIGQLKAGDTVRFDLWTVEEATTMAVAQNELVRTLAPPASDPITHPAVVAVCGFRSTAVLVEKPPGPEHPGMQVRLAGDASVLVEYGPMVLDLRLRLRVHRLEEELLALAPIGLEETTPGVRSLQIRYDPLRHPLPDLLDLILATDAGLGDLRACRVRTRVFHLPLAWDSAGVEEALQRYMRSIRPEAPYLPRNIDFIARNNGLSDSDVFERVHRASYICLGLGDVYLGACCAVPIDPRDRLVVPKFNPARTYTQEGTVGLGGAYMCIYPMDSPGGYQLVGRTLPIWNTWGKGSDLFTADKPWLLEMFDQVRFYAVTEAELDGLRAAFRQGTFQPRVEEEVFDVREYSRFLESIQQETADYQLQQATAASVQNKAEKESQLRLKSQADGVANRPKGVHENGHLSIPPGCVAVEAILDAKVWDINVKEGQSVAKGQTLVVLEAMKMESAMEAPVSGTVTRIFVEIGAMVSSGTVLVLVQTTNSMDQQVHSKTVSERFSLRIPQLLAAYRKGDVRPTQIVEQVYRAISDFGEDKVVGITMHWPTRNPNLSLKPPGNIWIQLGAKEDAMAAATKLESLPKASHSQYPLYGVPFVVKDNFDVAGWTTTAACPGYSYIPQSTAHCITKLLDAGAILIGKTNMDQFATGLVGTRSPYGACGNAYNPMYISGGSSSGSAVAVSLGFCSFSLGTDTAGSGRVPAAFNNIVGLKPTRGRISCHGMVPACKSLDCCSIFSLTADEAVMLLKVMEGEDAADEFSRPIPPQPPQLTSFRFGVPRADQLAFFGNVDAPGLFEQGCAALEACGGRREEVDFNPFRKAAALLYEGPWVAERLAAIEDIVSHNPTLLNETTLKIVSGGAKYTAVDTYRALYKLERLRKEAACVWKDLDVLVTPTTGTIYTIDEVMADPVQLNTNLGYYTNFMNLLDMSAVALPMGFQTSGLPLGITLSAPAFRDLQLCELGQRFQEHLKFPIGVVNETVC